MAREGRRWLLRPRFSLWAMLVLITVIAIPLSYVAHRRNWNLKRKAAYEQLTARELQFAFEDPTSTSMIVRPRKRNSKESYLLQWWRQVCLEDLTPTMRLFASAQWTYSARNSKPQITDADLRLLAENFPEIKHVYLFHEPKITDEGLSQFQKLFQLETLSLYDLPKATGAFLHAFPSGCSPRHLELNELASLEGRQLAGLSNMSQLTYLKLRQNPGLSDETLKGVQIPPTLTTLALEANTPFDVILTDWLMQVQLEKLMLNAQIGRRLAPALATQTRLEHLQIINAPLVDEDFSFLARCTELNELSLECMPIRGDFLASVVSTDRLRRLSLRATILADSTLSALERFPNVEILRLDFTPIQGVGFTDKMRWSKLQAISLSGCQFSENGKEAFARVPKLTDIFLPDNWTAEDLKRFPPRNKPKSAVLSYAQPVDPKCAQLPPDVSELRIDRCPSDLMKPVVPLLEQGKILQQRWERVETNSR